jgi:hypothetical protein
MDHTVALVQRMLRAGHSRRRRPHYIGAWLRCTKLVRRLIVSPVRRPGFAIA